MAVGQSVGRSVGGSIGRSINYRCSLSGVGSTESGVQNWPARVHVAHNVIVVFLRIVYLRHGWFW